MLFIIVCWCHLESFLYILFIDMCLLYSNSFLYTPYIINRYVFDATLLWNIILSFFGFGFSLFVEHAFFDPAVLVTFSVVVAPFNMVFMNNYRT